MQSQGLLLSVAERSRPLGPACFDRILDPLRFGELTQELLESRRRHQHEGGIRIKLMHYCDPWRASLGSRPVIPVRTFISAVVIDRLRLIDIRRQRLPRIE